MGRVSCLSQYNESSQWKKKLPTVKEIPLSHPTCFKIIDPHYREHFVVNVHIEFVSLSFKISEVTLRISKRKFRILTKNFSENKFILDHRYRA